MNPSLRRLEFNLVLDRVAGYAGSPGGRALVNALLPAVNRDEAAHLMEQTIHAARFQEEGIHPSAACADEADKTMDCLGRGALALEPAQLRSIGLFLQDSAAFHRAARETEGRFTGPLNELLKRLPELDGLRDHLLRITTPDGELSPRASPELGRLSRHIDAQRNRLSKKLSEICARFAGSGILRDSPPTIRSGRFVIPVTATRKSSVKGFVHDRSESGATLFIEPAELVEGGNELQTALLDLQQERRRILREATQMVRGSQEELNAGTDAMFQLDAVFARASYHRSLETRFPEEGPLCLRGLVHPLLPEETAVKSDIVLPLDWRVLVVSGPNAGGKSVLLKAVALASVCSRAGIGAHVIEASTMPFFSAVMVSMGDNQSIRDHLSTYSARLKEQRDILMSGNDETLAVVDEPAAGTDPLTGAALASVFLERAADSGVRIIVSTHLGQLKLLAMNKAGFINGSMSFNPETLTPGYRFVPFLPGASCTLEAAAIAGFPADVIGEASSLAGQSFSLDSLVASLRELEEKRREELLQAETERERLTAERKKLEQELMHAERAMEQQRRSHMDECALEMRRLRSKADSLLVSLAGADTHEGRQGARREIETVAAEQAARQSQRSPAAERSPSDQSIRPGDTVVATGWPDPGTVEKVGRSTAMVRFGSMLVKVDRRGIRKTENTREEAPSSSQYCSPEEKPEAMLLGMTVDEAVSELDIKLDNCMVLGLRRVRVVHGKGRLMTGVTEWLRRDRRVASVTIAPREEGGTGASIVILKG